MKIFRGLSFVVLSVWVLGSAVAADWQIVRLSLLVEITKGIILIA